MLYAGLFIVLMAFFAALNRDVVWEGTRTEAAIQGLRDASPETTGSVIEPKQVEVADGEMGLSDLVNLDALRSLGMLEVAEGGSHLTIRFPVRLFFVPDAPRLRADRLVTLRAIAAAIAPAVMQTAASDRRNRKIHAALVLPARPGVEEIPVSDLIRVLVPSEQGLPVSFSETTVGHFEIHIGSEGL